MADFQMPTEPLTAQPAPKQAAPAQARAAPTDPGPLISPEPGKVAIRDPDGSVWKIPQEQLGAAMGEGARPATEAEWVQHREGHTATTLAAAAMALPRGGSLGFSDKLYIEGARALGGDADAEKVRRGLNLYKQMRPDTSTAAEVVGTAPTLFFGGGGATARGAGFVARAAAAAPRLAAEGAVIGVGQQASEDALGDHKFVAEKYLTSAIKGGAVGVIAGTALHGAGEVAKRALPTFGTRAAEREAMGLDAAIAGTERGAPGAEAGTSRYGIKFDPNAGLAEEGVRLTESPIKIGQKQHRVGLETGAPGGESVSPISFRTKPADIDPFDTKAIVLDAVHSGNKGGLTELSAIRKRMSDNFITDRAAQDELLKQAERDGYISLKTINNPKGSDLSDAITFSNTSGSASGAQDVRHAMWAVAHEPAPKAAIGVGLADEAAGLATGAATESPLSIGRGLHDVRFGGRGSALEVGAAPISIEEKAAFAAERAPNSTMGRFGAEHAAELGMAEKMAYQKAYSATGARIDDVRRLGQTAEAQELARIRIGKTLTEQVEAGPFTTIHEYAAKITDKAREIGKSIRPMFAELDAAAARPSMSSIESAFNTQIRKPGLAELMGERNLRPAEEYLEAFMKKTGGDKPSFTKLYELRRDLDKELTKHWKRVPGGPPPPPGEEAVRGLRDIVQNELMTSAERASQELGKPIAGRIDLANQLYHDLAAAKSAATRESARVAGRPMLQASDMMAIVAAAASGSPIGAVIPIANVIRKKFGDQIAAFALRKAAGLEGLAAASKRMEDVIDKGARAAVEGKGSKRPVKTFSPEEIRAVRDAASNPQAVQERIAQAIEGMREYAPKVAAESALVAGRVAGFLATNLPKDPVPSGPIFTSKKATTRPFSDSEIRKASAMLEVAEDPTVVLDRLDQGLLMKDHVRALKAMHPSTYLSMQSYLIGHATEIRPEMSIQQQIALSIMFEKPIARVMERSNIDALQASFVGGNQAKGGKKGKGGMGPDPIANIAGSIPKMAAGPVKGGGTRATTFDLAERGERGRR